MEIQNTYLDNPLNMRILKQHLRIFDNDEDELIEMYANNALGVIEDVVCGNIRDIKTTISLESVNVNQEITLNNLKSIVSVKSNNVTISESDYLVYENVIVFWKEYESVVIEYLQTKIDIKYLPQCINLIVADWYENREGSTLDTKSVSVSTYSCLRRLLGMHSQPVK